MGQTPLCIFNKIIRGNGASPPNCQVNRRRSCGLVTMWLNLHRGVGCATVLQIRDFGLMLAQRRRCVVLTFWASITLITVFIHIICTLKKLNNTCRRWDVYPIFSCKISKYSTSHFTNLNNLNKITWRFNLYSAGIDFRRQNLTSVDVRFLRLKSIPRSVRVTIFLMVVDP